MKNNSFIIDMSRLNAMSSDFMSYHKTSRSFGIAGVDNSATLLFNGMEVVAVVVFTFEIVFKIEHF